MQTIAADGKPWLPMAAGGCTLQLPASSAAQALAMEPGPARPRGRAGIRWWCRGPEPGPGGTRIRVYSSNGSLSRRTSSSFCSENCGETMSSRPSLSAGSSTVKPIVCAASNKAPEGVRT